jgi:hypothetical protein
MMVMVNSWGPRRPRTASSLRYIVGSAQKAQA